MDYFARFTKGAKTALAYAAENAKALGHNYVGTEHLILGIMEEEMCIRDRGKCLWGKFYGQWFAETVVFVYDYDKFIPPEMLRVMSKYKITTFCAPPTIYRYFIKEDLKQYDLSSLRYATTAGEALNPEVFDQFRAATGIDIKEAFGQTETTMLLGNFTCMKGRKGSLGRPSPLYDVDIVDEQGNSVRAGEVGEICIRTEKGVPYGMFMEYYRDPERTKEVWHDNIYRTGDLAWKDEEGYYWYVGLSLIHI